jgi:hypothetical protein
MLAAAWRAFSQAARWKGQAPQTATGAASIRANHCQLVNCRAGIMESSATGIARAVETDSRRRNASVSASSGGAASVRGGSGSLAVYPVATIVAMASSMLVPAGRRTVALSVA